MTGAGTFDYGTSAPIEALPALHYHFVEWTGDVTGSTNPTSVTMDGAKSVTAHFALGTYALATAVDPALGGTVTGAPDVRATALRRRSRRCRRPGYHFVEWTGDVTGSANPTSVTMDGAKSVTAHFAADAALLVTNTTRGLSYATIKEAIDASTTLDGDEISIAAGVFVEQVVVNKALIITGAGCGNTVIKSPATLTAVLRAQHDSG